MTSWRSRDRLREMVKPSIVKSLTDSFLNLSTTAPSLQRQRPLKHVPNCQNNLSTTASFFQGLMKKSFHPYSASEINRSSRILIVLHLYCCSKHKLPTILVANAANLARFVTPRHFDSREIDVSRYFISMYY